MGSALKRENKFYEKDRREEGRKANMKEIREEKSGEKSN